MRGQAYIEVNKLDEACADLQRVKQLIYVDWYDPYFPVICKSKKVEEPEPPDGGNE